MTETETETRTGTETRRRKLHPPELWVQAQTMYLSGMRAQDVAQRTGIRENTIRQRAFREGWTRKADWRKRAKALAKAAAQTLSDDPVDGLDIAEAALARAVEALRAGRAAEAAALIKAGDAVGDFAEFVKDKRRRASARREDVDAPEA